MKRQITDIQTQKKHPSRRSIFLDGKFFCGISEGILNKYQLKQGMEIDEDKLKALLYEEEASKAKNYVYMLLARRMYTNNEIDKKLSEQGYSEEIIQYVISTMEKFGYLNDKVFAEEWVQSRTQIKPKGKIALRRELQQKGVQESVIEETLDQEIDESKESDMALEIARRKIRSYSNDDPIAARRKLRGFLLRRGFGFEIVKYATEQVLKERDE